MKKIFLIPLALLLSFCRCPKTTIEKSSVSSIESICPENGKCTIQIFRNKSLNLKADEFGSIYYQMLDNPNTSIIQYEYNRTVEKGLQDGQHREEIIFEINNADKLISLTDAKLQDTKMLFGRHCFCKGQAGYFKVEQGTLNLKNEKGIITISLDFQITKVPQLYSKVYATIK
jgi:hypothetical protein